MSSTIRIASVCQHCRQEFIAKTTVTKYCGDTCSKRAYKARIREQKVKVAQTITKQQKVSNEQSVVSKSYYEVKTLDYLTVHEAAAMLKCDARTIYNMVHSGRINSINLSVRKTRILKKDIDSLFLVPENLIQEQLLIPKPNFKRDCLSIGEILKKYNLHEKTLASIIAFYNIPKFQEGKFVYLPKQAFEPVLRKFIINKDGDSFSE